MGTPAGWKETPLYSYMYYCHRIINLLLAARETAYWHDKIQMKLLCSSISLQQCHPAHCCHSPWVFEPEISVGWVSETSEEVFFMTRNKKDKSSRCHHKRDTRVWDDGGLESPPPLEMTQHSRLSPTKRTFITAKENRRNQFGSCELSKSGSPGWYLRRGDSGAPRHVCTDGGRPRSTFK